MQQILTISGQIVLPDTSVFIDLPLPPLYTHTPMTMPVHIIHGKKSGPRLFICAAIHGDELNGVEIIRRLLKALALKRITGTLIAIPMVNVYGIIHHSRYLPDRRDLNRSFPGSKSGALASRIADLFMSEIVANSTHGIDLHTGAIHRSNLPQIRANLDDETTLSLAKAFNVPVLINANLRDGSLRESAAELGIPMLLYEAGEALRFDEVSIRAGVRGILNVMRHLGMIAGRKNRKIATAKEPYIARSSSWIRAPGSGIFRTLKSLGCRVAKNDLLGMISDPVSSLEIEVISPFSGIIIGRSEIPLVHEGEAVYHIAKFEDSREVAEQVENFHDDILPEDNNDYEELAIV
ncbi:succinylglutamate desuccinylase/aspartoacylase family protein [Methylobacter sp. S3L5C]|uniref:succinylglutamate desuccinylase/aspartoacylase family protein n=1 Tax=Methylobacter sp. S3L5C TaxID=2839024 RepID=UPI001FADD984|nr:succinylglutamate desuccinylase/aspartoacylase family protein [Methylobacter sp. S3L5C]UOA08080.1 succinylglutamate desuccinylase/aspartoacylase family protein [Methylobacter sp. S3L5C]